MSIRMVALDLDGTALNSAGKLSERTIDSFARAAAKGVHIVVSTGRSYNSLPEQVKGIPFIEYAITSNGAHINLMETGEAVYDSFVSGAAVSDTSSSRSIRFFSFIFILSLQPGAWRCAHGG